MDGNKRGLILVTALLLVGSLRPTAAQSPPAAAAPACAAPEYRQFDFWIGDWQAVDKKTGEVLGSSRIERLLNGCVIRESWTAAPGGSGMSLSIYNLADKKWHYNWVSDKGHLLYMTGGFKDGSMVMSSEAPTPDKDGKPTWSRSTWTPMPPGRVRQVYETSNDGKTWTVAFDGIYVPKNEHHAATQEQGIAASAPR
jgi:hypothetical protein